MDMPSFGDIGRYIKIAAFAAQHEKEILQVIAGAQVALALVKEAEQQGLLGTVPFNPDHTQRVKLP